MDGTRVVFTLDDDSLKQLRQITHEAGLSSWTATIDIALHLVGTLQREAKAGGTQLIVRNPSTGAQRTIEICSLMPASRAG